MEVSAQAKEVKALKAQVKKLKKGVKPLITHHKAWMKSVALKTRLARKTSLKKKGVQKEYVSKQGRNSVKSSKGEPSVHKDPAFDDLDDDAMDYMETKDAQDEGRTSSVMLEEKVGADKEVSTKAPVSTILIREMKVARKVQEEWEAEEKKKRLDEEEATKAALSNEYDFIQARLNADKILAE
ncbi:hypothetical protein Tco_1221523, partial [Tanacetum coccineum]